MNIQFVDGWTIVQTLGEGAFGEVKLLVNTNGRISVAMKTIDLKNYSDALEKVRKEAAIHCRLKHPNIVKYFGHRHTTDFYYIFLEYASGGELFDQIEPDVGMPQSDARKYFKELLAGVEYMHSKGVAHRDLKPENLLLDEHGVLKISDFGLATMFLCGEKRRKLEKKCGTIPYVAPEVLINMPYQAEPSDIWSCGIILVALLTGELPWVEATNDDEDFNLWISNSYAHRSPWSKLDTLTLSLARKILNPSPSKRYDLSDIKSHYWLKLEDIGDSKLDVSLLSNRNPGDAQSCFSLPAPAAAVSFDTPPTFHESKMHCFSQPTQIDNLLLSPHHLTSESLSTANDTLQKLVKRMTRFILNLSPEASLSTLSKLLDDMRYTWKINTPGSVTISTDERFVFKCNLISMNRETLLDFRLSKGCGLKFKKHFVSIKNAMSEMINKV